ncbi:glutamate receptor 3.2-like [Hevea brasiliensis]|uniref:glutamate receptor 3.2-like n=1 Tax=Hevea brasiliensis TaxID=3981 RepID=UPI0025E72A45|nr:glutamate receptor 3.2-like [Hevea brasiliensis]
MRSIFKESVKEHSVQKQITRFTVDVFEAAVKLLSYKLSFEIVPFYGDYDDLLKKVALKTFDAAIGDIVIRAEGYQLVEFSQSYVDTGLLMVVTTKSDKSQPWLFMSPFTRGMWFIMAAMSLLTGFLVWLIEYQNHSSESRDSPPKQIGTVISFVFAALHFGQGKKSTIFC